jgi:hypothetical protein
MVTATEVCSTEAIVHIVTGATADPPARARRAVDSKGSPVSDGGGGGGQRGAVFPPLQPRLTPLPLTGLPLFAGRVLSMRDCAGAEGTVADVCSWWEIDRRSILSCASNTTFTQLPVAKLSWYSSRMWKKAGREGVGVVLGHVRAWRSDSISAGSC